MIESIQNRIYHRLNQLRIESTTNRINQWLNQLQIESINSCNQPIVESTHGCKVKEGQSQKSKKVKFPPGHWTFPLYHAKAQLPCGLNQILIGAPFLGYIRAGELEILRVASWKAGPRAASWKASCKLGKARD